MINLKDEDVAFIFETIRAYTHGRHNNLSNSELRLVFMLEDAFPHVAVVHGIFKDSPEIRRNIRDNRLKLPKREIFQAYQYSTDALESLRDLEILPKRGDFVIQKLDEFGYWRNIDGPFQSLTLTMEKLEEWKFSAEKLEPVADSNTKDEKVLDPIDERKFNQMSEEFIRREGFANKSKLVIVPVSARRYSVVHMGTANVRGTGSDEYGFWSGELLYGPETKEKCLEFIENKVKQKSGSSG